MVKYIEINAAISLAKDICIPTKDGEWRHRCIDPQVLVELPAADVVEVVRCMDCKWYRENYLEYGDNWTIHHDYFCENWDGITSPNGYCMNGEKKMREPIDLINIEATGKYEPSNTNVIPENLDVDNLDEETRKRYYEAVFDNAFRRKD